MLGRPFGIILLAAVLLAAGLVGIAAFSGAWPRNANTSPLAALFALAWSCTYLTAGGLTWYRSRFAAPAFLAAIGLLLVLLWFIFSGGHHFLRPSFVVISVFVKLVPHERIEQAVTFESDDPAFAGEMRISWAFESGQGGTVVTVRCKDVPVGISPEDHQAGLTSTLSNLAAYVEKQR